MRKLALSLGLFLSACTSVQLSPRAVQMREKMSDADALAVVKKYMAPGQERGGICLQQVVPGTGIDPSQPAELSGTRLSLGVKWGKYAGTEYKGSYTITKYTPMRGRFTVDVRGVRQIRTWPSPPNAKESVLGAWCPGAKPGHFVMFYAQQELPNAMAPVFNPVTEEGRDELLAALTRLSPDAPLGYGVIVTTATSP